MKITCRRATSAADFAASMAIRESVFIGEQNVPADLERDGLEDECLHYLGALNGKIVATARVMPQAAKFKFQRVAVMKSARGTGLGAELMRFMMDDLAKRDDAAGKVFFLSSQVSAIGFYAQLGFEVCSDEYMDAGIQHRDMKRAI
ncbi:GNAT family N-acetyltransferase [Ahrensia sp. 13_GOM-1096m]|uniref:GNAT family N-acetyltransferase n=1 Tax=Ahrensia sp. 13_GOM-1096m TaxID=1380380 RepID=UPI00047E5E0C|nr:GNAT family N-acetyltransferase [Ahrensia sp. 13_GOM-1096m]